MPTATSIKIPTATPSRPLYCIRKSTNTGRRSSCYFLLRRCATRLPTFRYVPQARNCRILVLHTTDSIFLQILHYQVLLLLAADSVREKRLQFVKILNTMQIALVLINVVHFALNCKSADLNIAAMNSFLRTAEAFRSGQYATGARLYSESLSQYNDPSDFYQGVRCKPQGLLLLFASTYNDCALQISLWFEALITLSVVAGFALVGVWALRKIYHTEHLLSVVEMRIADDNSHSKRVANLAIGKSKRIRLRIQLVLHLILFAYLFRAIFECMHAYAYTGVARNVDQKGCGVCDSCQNMATVMSAWFERNPQVQIISNILAGPVALVLGLYGMKAGSILRLARTSSDQVSSEPPMGSTLPPMGSTLRQ
jgi:hypothetical protein